MNENDENGAAPARLTRSKAAANENDVAVGPAKTALQTKKSAVNTQPLRKRAALGDVSNVTKGEVAEGKKPAVKGGLVSKAAQPTGIQKNLSRTNSSRSIVSTKETIKKTELKRSGSGVMAAGKRKTSSTSSNTMSIKEETPIEDDQPSRKKIHLETQDEGAVDGYSENTDQEVEVGDPIKAQQFPEGVTDLDIEDQDDPLMVAEYVVEIFEYMKKLEVTTQPNPDYMEHQEDLEWKMRGILIDWLIEVHTRFHLLPETLFLAVNIIDRFLSTKVVQLDRLQLVGVTGMFIASKYEEVISPNVANFRHVADDGFTEEEILSAERYVLTALNYDLSYPNPMNFLRRISKADEYDIQTRTLGKYLMEISLLDHRFMQYLPSHVAAASMYLARNILEKGEWVCQYGLLLFIANVCQNATLAHYAGYSEEEIQPVFKLMVDYLARPVTHEAFFKKYASKRFLKGKQYYP
jgi:G2/mitotic-specific cyclin 2